MPYSIQIRFDETSEKKITWLSKRLNDLGVTDPQQAYNSFPHIALGVFQELDIDKAKEILNGFQFPELTLDLCSLGAFSGKENVIFLSPKPTYKLLELHENVYERIRTIAAFDEYYTVKNWVPHCTIGMEISDRHFGKAFSRLKDFFEPTDCRCERICITRFRPSEVLYWRRWET